MPIPSLAFELSQKNCALFWANVPAPAKRTEPAVAPVSVPPIEGLAPAAQLPEYSRPADVVCRQPIVLVAIDIAPVLPLIESALVEVVAVPSTVVVAKYKFPPAFLVTHWAIPAPAERAS